jgi:hypothetical protein
MTEDLSWLDGGAPELVPIYGMSKRQLAAALNVNPKTINKWLLDGLPARQGASKREGLRFDLPAVVEWLRAQERGEEGGNTLAEARRKAMLAIAHKRRLEAEKLAGNLVPLDIMERYVVERSVQFRQRLLHVGQETLGLTPQQYEDIETAIRSALEDFSKMPLADEFARDWNKAHEKYGLDG